MQQKKWLAVLFMLAGGMSAMVGCMPTEAVTPEGTTLHYKKDATLPTGPDTATVKPPVIKQEIPADQQKWVDQYNAQKESRPAAVQAAPRPAMPTPSAAPLAVPPALASPDDTKAAKERLAALKGTIKTAKNGAIISLKLAASGDGSEGGVNLDDMKLIGRLLDLESISFEGATFNDEFLAPLGNLKKLTSVTINNADIADATLEMLATLPELEFLDIRRDLKLTNAALDILAKMPKLTELHAHYNSFTNSGMAKIAKVPTLKIVDVRGCADVSDNGAKYLARLPELEELYFRFMITNGGVENLTAAQKLRFVEFQDCNDINDGAVESFRKMPALTELRIFRCKGFNDAALQGIASMPFTRLELRDLNISNDGIAALAVNTTLKTVELSELAGVDATGLTALLGAWKKLEKISFFSIPLTDEGLAQIATNSPELKSLQLRAVAVTDAGLPSLLKFTQLETLDLRENAGLSAEAMERLGELKNLKTLYIKGTGITAKGAEERLAALKKALPKCRIEE